MILEIQQTSKDEFGVYELDVTIDGKPYSYELTSTYAYDHVMRNYRAGRHGRALTVLNTMKLLRKGK